MLPTDENGRNWKKYPSITTKQLMIILNRIVLIAYLSCSRDGKRKFTESWWPTANDSITKQVFVQCNQLQTAYKFTTMGSFIGVTFTCVVGSFNLYDSVYSGISSCLQVQLAQVYRTKIKDDEDEKSLF